MNVERSMGRLIAAGLALCAVFARAETRTWIGTGACAWSDENNWKDRAVPTADYADDVVFANAAAADISFAADAKVRSLKLTGADVTLQEGKTLWLSDGTCAIDVPAGVTLTLQNALYGLNRKNILVKEGPGALTVKNECKYFCGCEVRAGMVTLDKAGDAIDVQPRITVFDGATVVLVAANMIQNNTMIEIRAGGVLETKGEMDTLGGFSGAGTIRNATDSNPRYTCTLQNGPYVFTGTSDRMTLNLSPTAPEDPASRFIIGTETGLSKCYLDGATLTVNPFDYILITNTLRRVALAAMWFPGATLPFNAPTNMAGETVTLVGASVSLLANARVRSDDLLLEGATCDLHDAGTWDILGGGSTGTTYTAYGAAASIAFAGGTALEPVFKTGKAETSFVLGGGVTTNATWTLADNSAFLVTGGMHHVSGEIKMCGENRTYKQTDGHVTLARGALLYQAGSPAKGATPMPFAISGGTFVNNAYGTNRGMGMDLSGEAVVTLSGGTTRIASDGFSHTIRIRDKATLNVLTYLAIMCSGSVDTTGTLDLAGGTLNLHLALTEPSSVSGSPSYVLFNGGHLVYPALTFDLNNGHGSQHHVWVGTNVAHVTVSADLPSRVVTFATPFEPNPANAKTDGGLLKDGNGTLALTGGSKLSGPIVVRDGALTLGATAEPAGSITLEGAALQLPDVAGESAFAAQAGATLTYAGASELRFLGTDKGGTAVFGNESATTSAFVPADDASFLLLRNDTPGKAIGTDYRLRVNGGMTVADGCVVQNVFGLTLRSGSGIHAVNSPFTDMTFLAYDAEAGFVPAAMTAFAEAGASDLADVTAATAFEGSKTVRGLRLTLDGAEFSIASGGTLHVGDGTHPAAVLFNNLKATTGSLTGKSGTLDFGTSRGFILANYQNTAAQYNAVEPVLAGSGGIVFGGMPEARNWIHVAGNNTYAGGTWISGARVTPTAATAFGAGRDIHVTGNAAWGGQLSLETAAYELDYDLHLAGRGIRYDSANDGALRATQDATVKGTVEVVRDARIGVVGTLQTTLTLAGTVSGTNALEKSGAGVLKLTADNAAFRGAVEILAGTLSVTSAAALGKGTVTIGEDGTLRFENAGDIVVTNALSGSGAIALAGTGKVTFTQADAFAGIFILDGGTLELNGDFAVRNLQGKGTVSGSGTLTVEVPTESLSTFDGTIAGDVSVVKRGGGELILAAPSTYSGATDVTEGILSFDGAKAVKFLCAQSVFHLDASDETTLTHDADNAVSEWRDAEGRDIAFVNETLAERPTYVAAGSDGLAGKGSLRFDKVHQYLASQSSFDIQTIIIVHRNRSGTRPSDMHASWANVGIFGWSGVDRGLRFLNGTTYETGSWGTIPGVRYCMNGTLTSAVAMDAVTVADVAYQSVISSGSSMLAIGDYWHDYPSYTFKRSYYGDIGEVIVFSRKLTEGEHAILTAHLMAKWGVTQETPAVNGDVSFLPSATTLTVSEGACVDLSGTSASVASLAGAGCVTNSGTVASTLTLTGASDAPFAGTVGDGVQLNVASGATFVVNPNGAVVTDFGGSGRVTGGPLAVTGWIRPGGTNAIGTLTFARAPVVTGATLEIEGIAGLADKMVVEEPFDVSPLALYVTDGLQGPSAAGMHGDRGTVLHGHVLRGQRRVVAFVEHPIFRRSREPQEQDRNGHSLPLMARGIERRP